MSRMRITDCKKKDMHRKGQWKTYIAGVLTAAVCLGVWSAAVTTAYAEENAIETEEGEITVRSKAFLNFEDPAREDAVPAETYLWGDQKYQMKSYQIVTVTLPEIVKYAQETILYEGVEQAVEIPGQAEVQLQDEETGRSASAWLPLENTVQSNGRWQDDFSFPVTVWGYDAGSFVLGGETVPVVEEHPFAGRETALLELIGVDPAYYQIDSAEWSGMPQTGEDGLTYRQATAVGRKYVTDVEAVYGGRALIPQQPGMAYETVYVMPEETEPEMTEAEPTVEMTAPPVPAAALETAAMIVEEPAELPAWLRIVRNVTTVVVGLGILLTPLFLWLLGKRRRREIDEDRKKV